MAVILMMTRKANDNGKITMGHTDERVYVHPPLDVSVHSHIGTIRKATSCVSPQFVWGECTGKMVPLDLSWIGAASYEGWGERGFPVGGYHATLPPC